MSSGTIRRYNPLDSFGTFSQYGRPKINAEPASGFGIFQNVLSGIAGVASTAVPGELGEFSTLMQAQLEAQKEMQVVNFFSNTEKSKHETFMAPIRNIKS